MGDLRKLTSFLGHRGLMSSGDTLPLGKEQLQMTQTSYATDILFAGLDSVRRWLPCGRR
jgi:hypothetical protein